MKKILITGGAGYIGTHTAVELLDAGYDIVAVDNLSNSKETAINRVKQITGKDFPFINIDVCDKEALNKVFKQFEIDAVIHFAGLKAVGESVENPNKYYSNNLNATLNLLDVMKENKVHHLVFSSSATVYGVPDESPVKEDARTWCANPYGWTKLMSEQIIRDYANANKDAGMVILRYFNPVGAHKSGLIGEDPLGIPRNLMPFITKVAMGKLEKLGVFGNDFDTKDGTGVRDYIHVLDLAKGHIAAIEYAFKNKGVEVFNLGTGRGISVLELKDAFERANGVNIPYEIQPRRGGDIDIYYADTQKAMEMLGWKAEESVESMCASAYNWAKKNPNGYEE